MKIKYKVLFSVIISIVVFNTLFTVYHVNTNQKKETDRLKAKIVNLNKLIAETIRIPLWQLDEQKIKNNLQAFIKDPEINAISLSDITGAIHLELVNLSHFEMNAKNGDTIVETVRINRDKSELATLKITYTSAIFKQELNRFSQRMFFLTIGLIILNACIIFFSLSLVFRPLKHLLAGISSLKQGDLEHRIQLNRNDELGQLGNAFDDMAENLKSITTSRDELNLEIEKRKKTEKELTLALSEVKQLSGMLPICASCKKIRDDKGYWNQIETYISSHSEAIFSHSFCPECVRKLYPDVYSDES